MGEGDDDIIRAEEARLPESLPAELRRLREIVEEFCGRELAPLEATLPADPELEIPRETLAQVREGSRKRGLYGMTQPIEFGGTGAGPLALTVACEALAASGLRLARFAFGPGPGVLAQAEGELRARYLEPVLRGEKRGAFAFTEPDDATRPTSAVREGDELVVSGRKSYVTGGASADFVSALVHVEGDGGGPAMVVIDRDSPGLEIERVFRSLDGSHHTSIAFREVRVPAANVIGRIGEGMPRALRSIGQVRLALSAQACGLMQWTLALLTDHLRAPHRSGAPLGEREGVRLRYADLRIDAFAARSLLYRTARIAEAGDDLRNEGMATKIFASEVAGRAVDGAIQLVGGEALVRGHPLERAYREVRALRLAEGANDLLRINLARGALEFDAGRL